jgi:thiosulfate dehydrogenase
MARTFMNLAFAAVGIAALILGAVGHPPSAAPNAPPRAPGGADPVRYGRDLVFRTYAFVGPEIADASRRYAGNNLACASCHLDGGTKTFGLSLFDAERDFPSYRGRSGKIDTIADRINECMTRSLDGRPLPPDGREMVAIAAYLKSLSTVPSRSETSLGPGPGAIAELTRAADPARGRSVYAERCAACHGSSGEGRRNGEATAAGYAVPPLWGHDSFNDGAGLTRLINAASFIRNNMPRGVDWQAPALSVDDSWDVAAFVLAQPRPLKADLERDFPDRRMKPIDLPYGPYADRFSVAQHRLGPYQPIREARAAMAAADKADGRPGND